MRKLLSILRPVLIPNVGHLSLFAALGLTTIGILAIGTTPESASAVNQMKFLPIALVGMLICALPHHKTIVPYSYPLLIIVLIMLIGLLIPGMPSEIVRAIKGARRWYNLQVFLFQPSELAKIAFVMALACYLRFRENYRQFYGLLKPLLMTFVPMGLILVEPDLGTAMIFLPVFFAMMIAAGARLKHIMMIVLVGLIMMPAMYPILRPHQKDRIQAMVGQLRGDTSLQSGVGFQGYKAQTLVGAGGATGHELQHAKDLIKFNALPESHNDMVFAVICTRWGLLGGSVVIGLYLLFISGALLAAALNKDPYARLVMVGIGGVIFTQMFVNIGMTVGVLPITGMTLPFVSDGRSSLVASFLMVGLILNVASRRPMIMSSPSFEFDSKTSEYIHDPYLR